MGGLEARFYVRVLRSGRPPTPWIWAIHEHGRSDAYRVSAEAYRSAEEAWEAGREAFRTLGKDTWLVG